MKELQYRITDEIGLHARPAGQLVKAVSAFASKIRVGTPKKMVDAKRIMGVMGLALKQGDEMTLTFEGPDEAEAAQTLEQFLISHL